MTFKRFIKNKLIRILYKAVIGLLLVLFTIYIGVFVWLKIAWPKYIDKEQLIELADSINTTGRYPDSFYKVYDKIYPNYRQNRFSKTYFVGIWYGLIQGHVPKKFQSPIRDISYRGVLQIDNPTKFYRYGLNSIYLTFGLTHYTTPEKCFDFLFKNSDFLNLRIGLDSASNGLFNKSVDNLDTKEIIELILLYENPIYYNKLRFPERVDQEIEKLYDKYKASA